MFFFIKMFLVNYKAYRSTNEVATRNTFSKLNFSGMHKDFFRSQSELIKPVLPQEAQLGIFLTLRIIFKEMHLLLRDLIKD